MYYNINGISSKTPQHDKFWVQEFSGNFIFKEGDITFDLDNKCVELRYEIAKRIFGSKEFYFNILPSVSLAFPYAGIDAELKVSKEEFEKFVLKVKDDELSNKLLYFYDCSNILGTIQNGILETKFLIGQFYKTLNENTFLSVEGVTVIDNGVQYASGLIVTNITSLTNHIFINLYSQLDFITKFVYELEHLHTEFKNYPRLKSKDVLLGDSKRTSLRELKGSLFESSEGIRRIIYLRNEIVHNSSIDSMPKVYQVIREKEVIEKYILLPDHQNGIIKSYKNRKRFFDDEIKLNEILPELVFDFWKRLKLTLDSIK